MPAIRAGLFGGSVKAAFGLVLIGPLVAVLAGPVQAGSVLVVSHGDRAEHAIALTFDDGVSPANCRRILAILVDEAVPATFFPLAEAMRLDPAFWRLVVQAGYPVGNHTLTHPEMPDLSLAGQVGQIELGRVLEESILGRPTLDVFRPPYGAYDAATLVAAATAGYPTVLTWDQSDRDTSPTGHEAAMLEAAELGGNGSVILLHCGPNATPYLLRPLIKFYRSQGYRFETIPQMLGIAWSRGATMAVTPSEILAGLSALPASSSGGPITGPNGWVAPARTASAPEASPPPATARPAATSAASPTPAASVAAHDRGLAVAGPKVAGPRVTGLAVTGLAVMVLVGLGSLASAAVLFARGRGPHW